MYSEYYDEGTVSVVADSAIVTGVGTAWTFFGVINGGFQIPGYPSLPVLSVQSDTELTLRAAWPHETLSNRAYWIGLVTSDQVTGLQTNWLQSQILSRNVGNAFKADATGSLGDRDDHDGEAEGFTYGVLDDPENPVFYIKASDADGDWLGPFKWRGPAGAGEPGSSHVVGTSTSSLAIGTGSRAFVIAEASRGWGVGARLRASSDADGADFMEGVIVDYSGSSLELAVDLTGGAGTHADWTINLAGLSGRTIHYGTAAPSSGLGGDGDFFVDTLALDIYGPKSGGSWGSPSPMVTATFLMNLDGGSAASTYGGTTPADGGDATPS